MSVTKAFYVSVSAWILSLPSFIPALPVGNVNNDSMGPCKFKNTMHKQFLLIYGLLYFCLPVIIILSCQIKIILLIRKYYKEHSNLVRENPDNHIIIEQRKNLVEQRGESKEHSSS